MSSKQQKRKSMSQPSMDCFFTSSQMRGLNMPLAQENVSQILGDDQMMNIFSGSIDEPLVMSPNTSECRSNVLSPISPNIMIRTMGGAPHKSGATIDGSSEKWEISATTNNPHHSNRTPSSKLTTSSSGQENVAASSVKATFGLGGSGNHVQVQMSHRLETNPRLGARDHQMIGSKVVSAAAKLQMNERLVNSPSASSSLRSLQTMRNEKAAYFDVSHTEQDLITEEERHINATPITIQEVMKNVVVYVEVRTESENRSEGIKTVIKELGATVNDRLLRNTTHVIFKDGLQSSYQKARTWNIPVVSILWIEACRKHVCLMDPKGFVISNVDRYEHPEFYGKRNLKSLQPTSDKSRRPKNGTPKAVVPEPTVSEPPKIRYPHKPKDNLPNIFANFAKNLSLHTDPVDECFNKNSKILEIIRNSPVVTENQSKTSTIAQVVTSTKQPIPKSARRTLFDFFGRQSGQSSSSDQSSVSFTDATISDSQESQTGDRTETSNFTLKSNPDLTIQETQENEIPSSQSNAQTTKEHMEPPLRLTRRNSMQSKTSICSDMAIATETPTKTPRSKYPSLSEDVSIAHTTKENMEPPLRLTRRNSMQSKTSICSDMSIATGTPTKTPRSKYPSLSEEVSKVTMDSPRRLTRRNSMQFNTNSYDMSIATPTPTKSRTMFPSLSEEAETSDLTSSSMDLTEIQPIVNEQETRPAQINITAHESEKTPTNKSSHSRRTIHSSKIATSAARSNALLNTVLQRNTMNTPQSIQVSFIQSSEQPDSSTPIGKAEIGDSDVVKTKPSARRRTLFTPNKVIEYDGSSNRVRERDQLLGGTDVLNGNSTPKPSVTSEVQNINSSFNTPHSLLTSHISKSNHINMSTSPVTTSPIVETTSTTILESPEPQSILEAYNRTFSTPTFSSTRLPSANKRRTIFEMSMDIIDQRVQNINRIASARKNRSMSESDINIDLNAPKSSMSTIDPSCAISSPQLRRVQTDGGPMVNTELEDKVPAPAPRKRKLFAPASMNFGDSPVASPVASGKVLVSPETSKGKTTSKRLPEEDPIKPNANKRPKIAKSTTDVTKNNLSKGANSRRTTLDFSIAKKKTVVARPQKVPMLPKKFIVSTNMHREQIATIQETVSALGDFELENNVSSQTTHVVSLEPLRTINFLRGIIRGLWILRYDWVTESAKAGRWLPEDSFEVRDFSAAVSICRFERQAFGPNYRIDIFADLPPVFISTANCNCPDLRDLFQQCGGRVTSSRMLAKYVISDIFEEPIPGSSAVCVSASWILDSVSIAKRKRIDKYLLTSGPIVRKE